MSDNINIIIGTEENTINVPIQIEENTLNIAITQEENILNLEIATVLTTWGNISSKPENIVYDSNYIHTDNNYTTSEKSKLAGIQSGAEVNVNADWNAVSGDAQILNKPDITSLARQSISENVVGLDYNNSTGVLSLTNNYIIPTLTDFNNKVDKEVDKGLSENDFTDTLKSKLDDIESGAQVNTVNSINSKIGNVVLTTQDISENTNLYYTNSRADARINAQKGVANGIAELDSTGKVPLAQLPPISGGGITYKGTWDASTGNYPTLTPNDGEFWVITVSGTISGIDYAVGDWIIYSVGDGWSKVPSGSAVSSVNGKTGTVILSTTDISEGSNLYYTDSRVSLNSDVIKGVSAFTWGNHALSGYADNLEVVHLQNDETIYGNKTFDDETFFNKQVAIGSNTFDITNPEFLKVDGGTSASINIISGYSNYDDYVQLNIKNSNDGEYASSDFVATADIGQEGANYIDVGINNSNYNSAEFTVTKALDGYAFVDGGDFAIGTATSGKNIKLFTGGTSEENIRAELSDTEFNLNVDITANNLSGINTGDQDLSNLATKPELNNLKSFSIAMSIAL